MMEGMLWKWTNYFSGWQPRWFVLDNGILSYYSSQDDILNGCKGSMKISACDVSVHSKDVSRLDLVVPGEAHFYLKAASPQERQQWLIALGTAKACPAANIPRTPSPLPKEVLPEDELKAKKSELRIYCDLLMQQVHGVKCAINAPDGVNVEQLNDSTSLLSATCDTFIQTLDDCVELAHAKFNTAIAEDLHFTGSASKLHSRTRRMGSRQRSISPHSPDDRSHLPALRGPRVRYHSEASEIAHPGVPRTIPDFTEAHEVIGVNGKTDVNSDPEEFHETSDVALPSNGKVENRLPSFFTGLAVSFLDVRLTSDSEIPTIPFLDACHSGLHIFDKLSQTAFAPAKLDIAGNVKKVHHKYLTNPDAFDTLQKIVRYELQCGHSHSPSSATLSLLWLNRSLQFINEFLIGFMASDHSDDLIPIANTAYSKSLMPYHGWVVRGAFAMAMKSSPSRAELLTSLAADSVSADHPAFEQSVLRDMSAYSSALTSLTHMLHSLFENNNLNFADQV